MFEAVLDDLPTVCTPAGGRRCRPGKVHGDKGYDYRHCRAYLTRRGIKVRIARRGVESSERLGRHRWKAERTIAWLFGCRRLRVRYDRASERFYAFAMLACARLCYNRRVSADTDHPPRSPPTSPVPKCPLRNDRLLPLRHEQCQRCPLTYGFGARGGISNPRPSDYESKSLRPAGAAQAVLAAQVSGVVC